jgi:DNA repair protein RadC
LTSELDAIAGVGPTRRRLLLRHFGSLGGVRAASLVELQRVPGLPGSVATDFSGPREHADDSWKLRPEDVAEVVIDLLRHPGRSLPSKVEIRPSRTK